MTMNERDMTPYSPPRPAAPGEMEAAMMQMREIMRSMADMMRATNERMAALEREVRQMTKVTPAQASAINAAIRQRASELCESYRAAGCEKAAGNAIRRAVRLTTGTSSMRELPRCEYSIVMDAVRMWDDRKAMKAIKAKGGAAHGADEAERARAIGD